MASVKEGFICPMCMQDLGDVLQLEVHFHEKHNNTKSSSSSETKSVLNIIDGLKKKVDEIRVSKKPLLSKAHIPWKTNDTDNGQEELNAHPVTGIHYDAWPESYHPVKQDFYEEFSRLRSKKTDRFATDTNKLIIRLEKLMTNLPNDPVKRRNHEKNIVPWMDEETVKRCPDCSKSFNVTKRKHHCRLCGSVLCAECSCAISFDMAKRLINPATISEFNIPSPDHDSSSSFRSCKYCADIIKKRDSHVRDETGEPPIIVQYYEHLKDVMAEADEMSKFYTKMVQSLQSGETDYRLEDAKYIRVKIMKVADNIDAISKRILANGLTEGEEGGTANNLQERVRSLALMFIKDNLVGLDDVPSESEFEILKFKRLEETSKRVEDEKISALIAQKKYEQRQQQRLSSFNMPVKSKPSIEKMRLEDGFVLSPNASYLNLLSSNDDPILQQIHIIEGYISEAKNANRINEVQNT
ncbi:RBSN [Lepeophtheirus salmonis]|uniref:RBSN n=1 Tax=Lepeophtheirus salmonis TaxID=72036 RepID=A0A7R8CBU2_LEPSM|nr:RBSN [Lepeophtheirus salmonis]CAF2759326.1 RBSN [Lepeophtheirus salmonis]